MGQFKPMVKMETTEPSVILKLKKGGKVEKNCEPEPKHKKMAMGGGMKGMMANMPMMMGRPKKMAPTKSPSKPSMTSRVKSMMPKAKAIKSSMMPPMKEGGKADKDQDKTMVKKAFKQHDSQQHKGGTKLSLKMGGKACATGGVAMSNAGGYKKGGMMGGGGMHMMPDGKMMKDSAMKKGGKACATGGVAMSNAGGYKDGGMTMVNKNGKMVPDFAADGKGKMKKGGKAMMDGGMANKKMMMGGYATGGVAMANAGGYKHGGKTSKKAFAMGGTVNTGKPVAMHEGDKSVPASMSIKNFSGTYKNGGGVENQRLVKMNDAQNAPAVRASKADTNLKYPQTMNSPQETPNLK